MPMPSPIAATSTARILACENAGITVTLPKPMTSNSAHARFGKQDGYLAEEDVYIRPVGEKLAYRYTSNSNGGNGLNGTLDQCLSELAPSSKAVLLGKERRPRDGSMSTFSRQGSVVARRTSRKDAVQRRETVEHLQRSRPGWGQPIS